MVKVEKKEFNGIKNCVVITNSKAEVVVSTEFGPRIISYSLNGKPNFFADFTADNLKDKADIFKIYGGHRVWHAPEVEGRTNLPDNSPCPFEIKKDGVTVMSTNEKTQITKGFDITMHDDGTVTIDHTLVNNSLFDIELSIWALTVFAHGGLMAVPNSTLDTGLVGNRCVSMWPYSKMNDRRVYFGDKYITLTPDKLDTPPFKFGSTVDNQYAYYFNNDQLFVKKFEYYYDAEYPNYYCNFESYTNQSFIEIETLSPLFTLEAGEAAVHTEKWQIFDNIKKPQRNDEAQIEKSVLPCVIK